jgi:hypothetical protein
VNDDTVPLALDEEADVEPLDLEAFPHYGDLRNLVLAGGKPFMLFTAETTDEDGGTTLAFTSQGMDPKVIPQALREMAEQIEEQQA